MGTASGPPWIFLVSLLLAELAQYIFYCQTIVIRHPIGRSIRSRIGQ